MAPAPPALTNCPRCGSPLAGESVQGLCARCLAALPLTDTETLHGMTEKLEALPPPTVEQLAEFFPQLELLGFLGRGGMGVVYQARQRSLDRLVALKLLAPERAGDPEFARRFAREARSLAALNHPHIVAVHDFGQAGGYFYLLMEYVDGQNLRQLLRTRRMEPLEALELIGPVCGALERAHHRGIIHRDIKPENLLIDRTGVVKIADFGICRILGETMEEQEADAVTMHAPTLTVGTPAYAAPEQLASAPLDPRADLYSLGVVLCEMLTGMRPDQQPLKSVSKRLPAKVYGIIARSLQAEPDARFANAAELRKCVAEAHGILEREPRRRKRRQAAGTAAAAVLILTGILTMTMFPGLMEPRPNNPQEPTGVNRATAVPEANAVLKPEPASREEALETFERNFSDLMEARRTMAIEPPQEGPVLTSLREKIHTMERRDAQLRAWIDAHPEAGG